MLDPHGLRGDLQQHPLLHRHRAAARCGPPTAGSASAGITRGNVLEVCRANGIPARETTFSLTDVYNAAEAFVTGTFAGVVPVRTVDGRTIGTGARGPVVERLQGLYREHVAADVAGRAADDRPGGDVVGPAQHLHGDDAGLGEPAGHRRGRRAVLRRLPRPHRARPSRPRRGDRLAADRPGRGGARLLAPVDADGPLRQAHDPPPRRRRRPGLGRRSSATCC